MHPSGSTDLNVHTKDNSLIKRSVKQELRFNNSEDNGSSEKLHSNTSSDAMFETHDGYQKVRKEELAEKNEHEEIRFEDAPSTAQAHGLSKKDAWNVTLLVVLYLLQGIPVGLAFGSIPFLLKSKISYGQIGIFSLASYPYSLKLLWSPIVDATFSKKIGRRKSWIIPIQLLMGIMFFWLGKNIDVMLTQEAPNVFILTILFFGLIFLSATQDVAVDGWALTLLSKNSLSYASTAQTIGLNTGYFLSFTVFLAFNSAEFSNKYIRSAPAEVGIIGLGQYLTFWALMYFTVTAFLIFGKTEENVHSLDDEMDIKKTYQTIWNICKLPHMRRLILVLLLAKIGFIANESVTGLKLLEKGFSKEDLALAVLIDFPFQIIFGYYAAKWSSGPEPLKPWLFAFYGRLFFAVVGMLVTHAFPTNGVISRSYFVLVITSTVLNSFMSTVQFVSISAFFTIIADPVIGGTYMTLLATFSNFGGTWPRYFVLEAVDIFTAATCSLRAEGDKVLTCASEQGKATCKELGGECDIHRDGYYVVSILCIITGVLLFLSFINPQIKRLQGYAPKMWSLKNITIQS